jgi:hypothetical protein
MKQYIIPIYLNKVSYLKCLMFVMFEVRHIFDL